jgi:hypothetical protein
MRSSPAHQARQQLESYLRGQAPIRDLWVWLMAHVVVTQAEQTDAEPPAALGDTILYWFEYSGGHIGEDDVRRYLADRLAPGHAS